MEQKTLAAFTQPVQGGNVALLFCIKVMTMEGGVGALFSL